MRTTLEEGKERVRDGGSEIFQDCVIVVVDIRSTGEFLWLGLWLGLGLSFLRELRLRLPFAPLVEDISTPFVIRPETLAKLSQLLTISSLNKRIAQTQDKYSIHQRTMFFFFILGSKGERLPYGV